MGHAEDIAYCVLRMQMPVLRTSAKCAPYTQKDTSRKDAKGQSFSSFAPLCEILIVALPRYAIRNVVNPTKSFLVKRGGVQCEGIVFL